MNTPTRVSLILGLLIALVIGGFFLLNDGDKSGDQGGLPETSNGDSSAVVRDDSHVLGEAGTSGVTFVEFLDFQCPSCAAIHPVVEELREKYEGQVTFVQRQFPLPSHPNAVPAALAAEAAAAQDELEQMSAALFESQSEWSAKSTEEATQQFREIADTIGLDLAAYDEAIKDDAMMKRIERDIADGTAAGVNSTPSLFVNGELLAPQTVADIEKAIDEALDR